MKFKRIDLTEDSSIIYQFEVSKEELANCEFSEKTFKEILKLEKSESIANQLEVLLEYFHAIEKTNRITTLARYLKYLEYTFKFANDTATATSFYGQTSATNYFNANKFSTP